MILRKDWFQFDDRVFSNPNIIIDIGCYSWDWSQYFLDNGRKVIGYDLKEIRQPVGAELRNQAVMPFANKFQVRGNNDIDATVMPMFNNMGTVVNSVSFDSVLTEFPMPSLIKMNIEGAEYPLLFSLKQPPADQLIVSFHDFAHFPYPKYLSEIVRNYLSVWYDWAETCHDYSWWMGLLKDELRSIIK
jgi:hypothetical protein